MQQGHWLTPADFLTAIAVGMVTPGPVMTVATFVGYIVAGPLGAVVCTIAIYLPYFLLVLLTAPPLMRHRARVRSFGASSKASTPLPSARFWRPRSCLADTRSETGKPR